MCQRLIMKIFLDGTFAGKNSQNSYYKYVTWDNPYTGEGTLNWRNFENEPLYDTAAAVGTWDIPDIHIDPAGLTTTWTTLNYDGF